MRDIPYVKLSIFMLVFGFFCRNFTPNRSRDTLVGKVQQTPITLSNIWLRQNTRFAGNVLSVVQYFKYALLTPCIVQNNALMLPTKGRRTERQRKQRRNNWQKRFIIPKINKIGIIKDHFVRYYIKIGINGVYKSK